jgi:2'-5' RNA ligase
LNLKKITSSVRWTALANIHITLKFLGEIEEDILSNITSSLVSISDIFKPITISITGSGVFPGKKNPRVIWLGIKTDTDNLLYQYYQWIENKLELAGIEREKRKFSPHLTIGRIKYTQNMTELYNYMEEKPFPENKFLVNDIVLMQSILKPSGAEYRVLHKFC